jgi:hypothetical protein
MEMGPLQVWRLAVGGWLVGSSSTACALESPLPVSEPVLFLVQGVQWLLWLVHDELFPPISTLTSGYVFCFGSEGPIASVTCLYAYTARLGNRLRAL